MKILQKTEKENHIVTLVKNEKYDANEKLYIMVISKTFRQLLARRIYTYK